jgi:hypothetical protein
MPLGIFVHQSRIQKAPCLCRLRPHPLGSHRRDAAHVKLLISAASDVNPLMGFERADVVPRIRWQGPQRTRDRLGNRSAKLQRRLHCKIRPAWRRKSADSIHLLDRSFRQSIWRSGITSARPFGDGHAQDTLWRRHRDDLRGRGIVDCGWESSSRESAAFRLGEGSTWMSA